MNLPQSVTLTRINGEQVSLSRLSLTFQDYCDRKVVTAHLGPHCRGVPLWEGEAYDAIGDWTQSDAESRILEILGPDINASLQSLVCN